MQLFLWQRDSVGLAHDSLMYRAVVVPSMIPLMLRSSNLSALEAV